MKFNVKEDIEAPIEFVFAEMSDFHAHERSALRRGADVQRVDTLTSAGKGMAWDTSFNVRGKRRELQMELAEYDPPNNMLLSSRSSSMGGYMMIDLVALSRGRTRLNLTLELQPKNLASKLLVQSLKLARRNVMAKFKDRVVTFAIDLEDRYKRRG